MVKIKLNSETAVEFVKLMNSLPYDVNFYDGHIQFDAKSLMAIMALDFRKEFRVEAVIDDAQEYEKFLHTLNTFKI